MLLTLLLLLTYTIIASTNPLHCKRPHIVFMIADDLGWNDVSFHGSKQIPTPNIDAIARDGIILNQYYVQPICSPSRGCLMSGKYAIKIGFQHEVIANNAPWGLPLKEKTLPQYFKELNYSTHAVGKWHLGFFKEEYLPTRRGFDTFFGYYTGLEDYFSHESRKDEIEALDLHENEQNVWIYNGTYGPDLFTSKAKRVIYEHFPSQPLFLYFSQQAPHAGNFNTTPLQAPSKYVDPMVGIHDEKRKIFAGMVSSLDHSVGEIFEALDVAGILNDTIFIFTTDNGGATQGNHDGTSGSNYPLKGTKYTLWEGGTRGVAFIWSSLLRQHSRIHNELMHITDWLPTLLSAVRCSEPLNSLPEDVDGVDQWPSIANNIPSPRSEILINIDDIQKAESIRKGRFKLVKGSYYNGKNDKWYDEEGKNYTAYKSLETQLYNEILYLKNYMKFLRWSKAARILWNKYDRNPILATSCISPECEDALEIKCGDPPLVSTCNALQETCLYDVITDPCEYYNIAPFFPEVTEELQNAIEKYRAVAIPPGDNTKDPEANPAYHGNAWVPWE